MPRWNAQGERVMVTIFDCAAFQYSVRATCRCGHSNVFDPHALWWRFYKKQWDDRLKGAGAKMRCLRCADGGRVRLEACRDRVTVNRLPMPDEGEWKRAVQRYRC